MQWDAVIFGARETAWHYMQKRGGARGEFSFNNSFNDQTRFEPKTKPGDLFRLTYFVGYEVQKQKVGNRKKISIVYKDLKCTGCDRIFRTRFGLQRHIESLHPNLPLFPRRTSTKLFTPRDPHNPRPIHKRAKKPKKVTSHLFSNYVNNNLQGVS